MVPPRLQYRRAINGLPYETTLDIDGTLMAQLKREAARQKRTMSEVVERALRGLFRSQKKREMFLRCPRFTAAVSR